MHRKPVLGVLGVLGVLVVLGGLGVLGVLGAPGLKRYLLCNARKESFLAHFRRGNVSGFSPCQ